MSERRRILSAEDSQTLCAWKLPTVVGPLVGRQREAQTKVVDLSAAASAAGFEQGYAKGHAEGLAAGQAAGFEAGREIGREAGLEEGRAAGRAELDPATAAAQAATARLEELAGFLAQPLADLDPEVESQLVALTLAIAKQLLRRELRIDPTQIIAIIRETVGLLPAAAREVRVHLHPEDAVVVRERLAAPAADRAWTIVEDPVMGRGGCRVTSGAASIDARLESRIAAVAARLLGEERSETREDPATPAPAPATEAPP